MSRRAQAKLIAALAVLAGLAVFTFQGRGTVSLEELERRVGASAPQWADYQEDIKAQLGATPAAEWEGKLISARIDGANLYVEFEIIGPWASREIALPLLAHDPLGNTYRNVGSQFEGARVTYEFVLDEAAAKRMLPWIELKYPHRERRLVFSDDGLWQDSALQSGDSEEGR